MPETSSKIVIIGAGLTGSLIAIFFAKRGYEVDIYEKRPDIRNSKPETGRSINLALSHRGLKALQAAGIDKNILKRAIPMYGRNLHPLNGEQSLIAYGKDDTEYINSISRSELNRELINTAEKYKKVKFYFEHPIKEIHLEKGQIVVENIKNQQMLTVEAQCFLGSDGAGSRVRHTMEQQIGYQSSSEFLDYGYKEITFPASLSGGFNMEKNALHIWPRGKFMLIALPNLDGSFTGTLFLANQGEHSFQYLDSKERVQSFFENIFPDALPLLPDITEEFFQNPVGLLGTVRCTPWHYQGKFLLIGDSAHAIVPFYGQGMNASFEDCLVLNQCLDHFEGDWGRLFAEYEQRRKVNTDAIAELAIENFYEMRDGVSDAAFLRKKELEHLLENKYSDYHSKYSLVTFHPEVSYAEAHRRGNAQNNILLAICRQTKDLSTIDLEEIYTRLKKEVGF
jgi:kynurenine 3-monooxygenase